MIDAQLNRILKPILGVFAKQLSKFDINPNVITFFGFFLGFVVFTLLQMQCLFMHLFSYALIGFVMD